MLPVSSHCLNWLAGTTCVREAVPLGFLRCNGLLRRHCVLTYMPYICHVQILPQLEACTCKLPPLSHSPRPRLCPLDDHGFVAVVAKRDLCMDSRLEDCVGCLSHFGIPCAMRRLSFTWNMSLERQVLGETGFSDLADLSREASPGVGEAAEFRGHYGHQRLAC